MQMLPAWMMLPSDPQKSDSDSDDDDMPQPQDTIFRQVYCLLMLKPQSESNGSKSTVGQLHDQCDQSKSSDVENYQVTTEQTDDSSGDKRLLPSFGSRNKHEKELQKKQAFFKKITNLLRKKNISHTTTRAAKQTVMVEIGKVDFYLEVEVKIQASYLSYVSMRK